MENHNETIKTILDNMTDSINQRNVNLYKKLVDEVGDMNIETYTQFFYCLVYPHRNFLSGLVYSKISQNRDVAFLLLHSDYVERHFEKIFSTIEGYAFCADKSSTVITALLRWFKEEKRIEWNYTAKYTYHLPKTVFTAHDEVIQFYDAVKNLYYGNPTNYLSIIHNYTVQQ